MLRRALPGGPDPSAGIDGAGGPSGEGKTARHAGHADLLREAIDGATGR